VFVILFVVCKFLDMKAEHTVASYNGRDFTRKIASVHAMVIPISCSSQACTLIGIFRKLIVWYISVYNSIFSIKCSILNPSLKVWLNYLTKYFSCSSSGSRHSNSQQRSPTRHFLQNWKINHELINNFYIHIGFRNYLWSKQKHIRLNIKC
jgi:hypothetical protein